ncbi:hypothetical protein C7B79_24670 [Chroococcidiopsis cubana CCALA 043]|nr:hypothetical protein C7B79_24670 [Chroococcidiopsis cubana CCALA 043]
MHQNRPMLVRDLPSFGRVVYLKVPRRQFYCTQWSAIQYRELRLYRLATTTYATIRRTNLSAGAAIESRTDGARRRNEL